MNTTEQRTIKYENPPINEIVCGVLFESINGLRVGHLGLLWQRFKSDFPKFEDHNPIGPITEEDLNPDKPRLPRVWFVQEYDNELVQVQFNRFIYNWRKRRPDDDYPGYEKVVGNFEQYLLRFQKFLVDEELGNLTPNRYELTYIDHILLNEGWETLNRIDRVFPSLISLEAHKILSEDVREINWQMMFGLPKDSGILQLSIRNAQRVSDNRPLLNVEFSAVSNEPYQPMRDWFDSAHEVINNLFSQLVSNEIQEKFWGKKS